ncbi:hypothetical protein CJD36_019860 [Flavipsychrobacter stenotrophus]|uniref:Uncharacterized protein n=1 Tax=Flavipsychrobacter stenotrophus TaxID=2077091 RepID=A0A2S7SS07_9BACT|nr:hypothetical protein [Flavipsychrobacter stenotrophus]PQJ09498.1 hypothetical protein CJD36_019860 [Flavipsychrobacter stenotrophus]
MAGVTFFDSKECEWADMTIYIEGGTSTKIEGIKYKKSKVKTHLHGSGNKAIGIQSGNETCGGEITALKGAVDSMNKAAVAAGGKDILDVSMTIVVVYQEAKGRPLETDTLVGVEISEFEKGWDQGATQMPITMPFLCLDIV